MFSIPSLSILMVRLKVKVARNHDFEILNIQVINGWPFIAPTLT